MRIELRGGPGSHLAQLGAKSVKIKVVGRAGIRNRVKGYNRAANTAHLVVKKHSCCVRPVAEHVFES
jgi:hypothetical protein